MSTEETRPLFHDEAYPVAPPAPPTPPKRRSARTVIGLVVGGLALAGGGLAAGAALTSQPTTATGPGATAQSPFVVQEGNGAPGYGPETQPNSGGFGGDFGGFSGGSSSDTSDASEAQSAGLVEISTTLANGRGAGTGLVLSSDGEIVTNHHVIEGALSIEVTVVSTGDTYDAQYVGSDSDIDVAVLQLDGASGLDTINGDTDDVTAGDEVTAVGDANGDGGSLTAAPGTVTATDQSITVSDDDGGSHPLSGLIELDADIVPGDSGGAVLDSDGDVVGMNVAASSGSSNPIGYAIPWDTVMSVVDAVGSGDSGSSSSSHGYLGIGLSSDSSTQVATVTEGSAAAESGLVAGDTITAIDGDRVSTASEVSSVIKAHAAGDRVDVEWVTADGSAQTASVTLGQAPIS